LFEIKRFSTFIVASDALGFDELMIDSLAAI
jgi:hypothetical protein